MAEPIEARLERIERKIKSNDYVVYGNYNEPMGLDAEDDIEYLLEQVRRLQGELAQRDAEIERLRGALKIYADQGNWTRHDVYDENLESLVLSNYHDVFGDDDDEGFAPARAALKEEA